MTYVLENSTVFIKALTSLYGLFIGRSHPWQVHIGHIVALKRVFKAVKRYFQYNASHQVPIYLKYLFACTIKAVLLNLTKSPGLF